MDRGSFSGFDFVEQPDNAHRTVRYILSLVLSTRRETRAVRQQSKHSQWSTGAKLDRRVNEIRFETR